MKLRIYILALLILSCGCTKQEHDAQKEPTIPSINYSTTVSVDNRHPTSRVVVTPGSNQGEDWEVEWDNGDALGGWSSNAYLSSFRKFSMTQLITKKTAIFSGSLEIDATKLRLIYPFDATIDVIKTGEYTINVSEQTINMSNDNAHLGKSIFLVSDIITDLNTSQKPTMRHLNTFIKLRLKLILPATTTTAKLRKIELGGIGKNGDFYIQLPTQSKINLNKEMADTEFARPINTDQGVIKATINNSPVIVTNQVHSLYVSAIPFTQYRNYKLNLTVHLEFDDGKIYNKSFEIVNSTANHVELERGKYYTLSKICDMTGAQETEYFGNWIDFAASSFNSGSGTSASPYIISTPQELARLALLVNRGVAGGYYKLSNDINLQGKEWTPIGTQDSNPYRPFSGNFNGNGFTVKGLYAYRLDQSYQALFGYSNGTVMNLTVEGKTGGYWYTAGVVGRNQGSIISCTNNCEISNYKGVSYSDLSGMYIGGITGASSEAGRIINCQNNGKVTGNDTSVAGICGANYGKIINCFNTASIFGAKRSGGIAGYSSGYIDNCFNIGDILGNGLKGGIAGENGYSGDVNLANCFYLNTSANRGAGDSNDIVGKVESRDQTQMKSADFLQTLNIWVNDYNSKNSLKAIPWRNNSTDNFPEFDK